MGVEYDGEIPGPEFFPVFPGKFKNRFLPGKVGVEGPRTPPGDFDVYFETCHGAALSLEEFPGNSTTSQFSRE